MALTQVGNYLLCIRILCYVNAESSGFLSKQFHANLVSSNFPKESNEF